ncbi:NADP-dependent oxidoreductase [Kibdelosporangium philippinense]|uniref:NADP-dependent oxidoreductase n=1 Tax=Kibdelosporangium philippinense TaxID=211113 RepID=A0ABS8ZAF0_9PSEU|nr:NADP-dependent oxidoreductase [Kibdelosporangium philippinense]MCE7004836.1 NADP-dependent oxidoreductase [Kibdelosporangium philippinense]
MKAARIHQYGGPEVIRIDHVDIPAPGDAEVLIATEATSFNPTELAVRQGIFDIDLPHTLGWDLAGYHDGRPVIGFVDSGAAAEFTVADKDRIVPAPQSIPLRHAAAIPLAGLTAWQVTNEIAKGQKVLINGAGGGIGSFAVQLAKRKGAYVIATASPRSTEAVYRHGADEVIDYTKQVPDTPVDVMIHLVGTPPPWPPPARERVISAAAPVEADVPSEHVVMRYDRDMLAALVEMVDAGLVTVDVTATYPIDAMADVRRKAGTFRGKVILTS